MPYICDPSALLSHQRDILTIKKGFQKHQSFLQQNDTFIFGILVGNFLTTDK